MLTKVQLFDASRCDDTSCRQCSLGTMLGTCARRIAETAIELLKENEELNKKINELLDSERYSNGM